MKFSELILHDTFKNFPLYSSGPNHKKPFLAVKNINISQYKDSEDRKRAIIKDKKQLMPHTNKNRFPNSNIKFLMEKTSKIISEKGKKVHQNNSQLIEARYKKNRYRAINGRPFSRSVNSWVSEDYDESHNLSRNVKDQKVKEYLSAAIHKTMLVKKVEEANEHSQVLSVRLNREKQYLERKPKQQRGFKSPLNIKSEMRNRKPRLNNPSQRRAISSHQNPRNFRVKNRKSTEMLQPW